MAPLNVGEADAPSGPTRSSSRETSSRRCGCSRRAGRFITPDEVARPGAEPVAVLSHDYWQTHFGGAPTAVGQTIRVNDRDLTIIGVAPEELPGHDPRAAVRFVGAGHDGAGTVRRVRRELVDRNQRGYFTLGRLSAGADEARATGELAAAMRALAGSFPESNDRISGELMPYWNAPRGPQMMFITALGVLQGVMLLVLLAVCGNTANLVLARASARHREVGVRLAFGAGPRQRDPVDADREPAARHLPARSSAS